jgi:hypothetical protein
MNVYLIGALVAAVLVAGAGLKGYGLGKDHVRAEYAARDLQQANENAAFAQKINEGRRVKEQGWAKDLAAVSAHYQGRLTDAEAKTTLALNAIRSGSVRLRDPGAKPETCRGSGSGITAPAGRRDGSTTGELSRLASEFLYSEAARADRHTEQLSACQAALLADRK